MLPRTILISALCACSLSSASGNIFGVVGVADRREVRGTAFAAPVVPMLRVQPSAISFFGERSEIAGGAQVEISTDGVSGMSMGCRRNFAESHTLSVKKEKRARNEYMARQHRKPVIGRGRGGRGGRGGGRGGGRAAQEAANTADSEWLSQIYGQHTIYRRDNTESVAAGKSKIEGAPKEMAPRETEAKETVAV